MNVWLENGFLFINDVPPEAKELLDSVVEMLRWPPYLIGDRQIEVSSRGLILGKRYELCAMLGHKHDDGSQRVIADMAKKTLGIEASHA